MGSLNPFSKPKVPSIPVPPPPAPPPTVAATPASKGNAAPDQAQRARAAAASSAGGGTNATGPQGLREEPKTAGLTLLGATK